MRRGKGICAVTLVAALMAGMGIIPGASAHPGARGNANAGAPAASQGADHASAAGGVGPASDPGNGNGNGNGRGNGRGGGGGDGASSSGGGGSTSTSGDSTSTSSGPTSTTSPPTSTSSGSGSSGAGGDPQGGDGGRGGSGSTSGDGGSTSGGGARSSGSGSTSSTSTGGQASGGTTGGRTSGGSGSNGNGNGGSGGRCSTSCHVGQQPPTGTPTYVPAPTQVAVPAPKPTTVPTQTQVPSSTHGFPTQTYSTSASDGSKHRSTSGALGNSPVGIVSGTSAGGTSAGVVAGATTRTGSSTSGIGALLGGPPAVASGTREEGTGTTGHGKRPSDPSETTVATVQPNPGVIQTFVSVIPPGIWFILAAALAVGAAGAAWALSSGRRVRRQASEVAALSTAALTDQLTGVLNRRGFIEAVERELARARRYDHPFVLAYVDVRGLKAVNDSEGHRAGDELLQETAHLLKASARADDVVGRLGGDEMGLLLVEQGAEGAMAVKARIEDQVVERRAAMGLHASWDLTIGTAEFPGDGDTVDDLLRRADLRLYEQRGIEIR